jgi:transcriptional regulator with XRE-family HTH domain
MSIESRLKEEVNGYISTNNLTLKQLAGEVGLTPGSLYNYMNGVSHPGNKLRERLKNVGIDIDYIMTGRRAEDVPRFNPLHYIRSLEREIEFLKEEREQYLKVLKTYNVEPTEQTHMFAAEPVTNYKKQSIKKVQE